MIETGQLDRGSVTENAGESAKQGIFSQCGPVGAVWLFVYGRIVPPNLVTL